MGVLSDLIMATAEEIADVPEHEVPINRLPGIDVKGIGVIELELLDAAVKGRAFDPSLSALPFVIGEGSEEGPWVNRLPDDLVAALGVLTPSEVGALANRWVANDHFQHHGWTAHDAAGRLQEICGFAGSALREGKPIHLWTCL